MAVGGGHDLIDSFDQKSAKEKDTLSRVLISHQHIPLRSMFHTSLTATDDMTLPTELTIEYLLGLTEEECSVDELPACSTEASELATYLRANGVRIDDSQLADQATLLTATKRLSHPSFWPKHAPLHPNAGRVKNWLWIHSRYRNQAKALLVEPPNEGDYGTWQAAFAKFHKKIQAHSEFEDTQLFKYFVDAKIGNLENLQTLQGQHEDLRTVEAIENEFAKALTDPSSCTSASLLELLKGYVEDLEKHLQLEEQTLVRPWLQLTAEQYKTYRSYLSWTYCFMY